jgi:hypothetical protein
METLYDDIDKFIQMTNKKTSEKSEVFYYKVIFNYSPLASF